MTSSSPATRTFSHLNNSLCQLKRRAIGSPFFLFQLVDKYAAPELGLKPGGLGRHDGAGIGNIHQILHGSRIHGKCHLHFTAVYPVSKTLQATDTAYEIDPLVGTGILDDDITYGAYNKKGTMPWYHMMIPQIVGSMGLVGVLAYTFQSVGRFKMALKNPDFWSLCLGISYLGILLMSQLNPGEFVPLPYELLTVVLFILQERRLENERFALWERTLGAGEY